MDGDIFGDTLVDDLLALSGAGGDFDTSDLMDILEPDYLENNILLDNTGSLTSLGDVAAFDDLGNFDDAPTPTADVHASFDAAVRTKAQEESNNPDVNSPDVNGSDVNGQNDMPQATPAKSAARASQARATPKLTTRQAQAATDEDEEDGTPEDPLEDVTSGMLPEDDLEALARLAAGEDEFPDDASDGFGLSAPAADPLETDTLEGGVNLDASDVMGTSAMSTSAMSTSMDEAAPSSGKNLLDDTLDERTQPNMDELEELALLASGGTDLGSVLMDEESQEDGSQEDGSQAQGSQEDGSQAQGAQAQGAASTQTTPPANATPQPRAEPQRAEPQRAESQRAEPQRAESQRAESQRAESQRAESQRAESQGAESQGQTTNQSYQDNQQKANPEVQTSADQNAASAVPARRFSQVASTWSQASQTSQASQGTQSGGILPATSSANERTALATPSAELVRNYRPPNQLRRYFNAGIMFEAADRLKDVLDIPEIPLVVFLGRAAERHLEHLPDHDNVTVAHLAGAGFVPSFQVPRQESFRRVLLAKDRADSEANYAESDDNQQGMLVADISDLELDDLSVALEGTHLLLTRLQTDPVSQEFTGTLTLVGNVDLRSGANFLRAVKEALESPITLMV